MKVTFAGATLADHTATPRLFGVIESIGGQSVVQSENVYGGANPAKFPRGNISGQFIFTSEGSYASKALAAGAFRDSYNLLNTQGNCQLDYGGTILTFANAILHQVQRVKWDGVRLILRYSFEITTIA